MEYLGCNVVNIIEKDLKKRTMRIKTNEMLTPMVYLNGFLLTSIKDGGADYKLKETKYGFKIKFAKEILLSGDLVRINIFG